MTYPTLCNCSLLKKVNWWKVLTSWLHLYYNLSTATLRCYDYPFSWFA
jgi:hypothetical protein